jgi:hypothetical protein
MDIVDMAIHPVVCRKYDFHRNSDFQNSQKLDPIQKPAKNQAKMCLPFKDIFVQEMVITKVE